MTKPVIAIPAVLPEEVDQLNELRRSVRRVHKSVPLHSPVRQTSADLSNRLWKLHRRGVPLHALADLIGLSHQAVRVRVRSAATAADVASVGKLPPPSPINGSAMLSEPVPGLALVADAGVHRRLHIFAPPEEAGPAYLAMIPEIPLVEDRDVAVSWLESEADVPSGASDRTSVTATRLRNPPAIYLPRAMVATVLVPLTTEESR